MKNFSVDELMRKLDEMGIAGSPERSARYAGELFVVKCGGALVENRETGDGVLEDVGVLASAGVRVVLVHGGSVQADREMEAAGIVPRRHRGLRITCERTIEILDRCFGQLNRALVERLAEMGVGAKGFHGAGNRLARAVKLETEDGVDLGFVGEIGEVDRGGLAGLDEGAVAVVSAIVPGAGETLFNVNADYVAARLALGLGASKLLLMTDVPGVMRDREDAGSVIERLTAEEAVGLIEDGTIARGMIPKIESALRAVEEGLPSVHVLDGKRKHVMLRTVFTDEACGTEIVEKGTGG